MSGIPTLPSIESANIGAELTSQGAKLTAGLTFDMCNARPIWVYVVPGEASWVCSAELLHVHALAGMFRDLTRLDDPRVRDVLHRWGVYYRERPLEASDEADIEGAGAQG